MEPPPAVTARADDESVALVLVRGRQEVSLGRVAPGGRCGLGFIDDLLHLQVALGRVGWQLRVDGVDPELEELLELTGLRDRL